jgi:TPR repeat protein
MWALIILLLLTSPLLADFKAGLEAFDRNDFTTAYNEWLPIAQNGDANAQFNIGLLYAMGKGVSQDAAKAAEWYRKAAEQGVAAAEYNLGVMYANGDGVTRDVHEAVKWLQKAADAGIPMGRDELANLYGSSAVANYAKSLEGHRKSAEGGNPTAQFDLALMYDLGRGTQRDYAQAMKWYRAAADQGYAPAMTNIGILYYNQEGVRRDMVQAYAWFVRAQLAHDPRAAELVQMAMDKMKGDQIRKGEAMAADWHPRLPATTAKLSMEALESKLFKQPGHATPISDAQGDASRETPSVPAFSSVQRVVAIGVGPGTLAPVQQTLQAAQVLDGDGKWIGGGTSVVITAGRVDPELAGLLDRLQTEAQSAGGSVHILASPSETVKINDTLFAYDAFYRSEADLDETLRDHSVKRVVIGHSDKGHGILPKYRGKLIVNDDPEQLGCLVIEYGKPFAMYRGRGLTLPTDEGLDLQRYQRQISTLR